MGSSQSSLNKTEVKDLLRVQELRLRNEFNAAQTKQTEYIQIMIDSLKSIPTKEMRFEKLLDTLDKRFVSKVAPVIDFNVRVFVMGMVSVGKSTLINALAGETVTQTGLDATTTIVKHVADLPLTVAGRQFTMNMYDCPGVDKSFDYASTNFVEH
jgi:ribosome biogenesis GTPase A